MKDITETRHFGKTMYECNYCDFYSHDLEVTKVHIELKHKDKIKNNGDI